MLRSESMAAPVGQHQGLLVGHPHEARLVAARRAVEPLRPRGRERGERRGLDIGAVVRRDAVDFLDRGGLDRLAVERFQLGDGGEGVGHW